MCITKKKHKQLHNLTQLKNNLCF
ncbi:hypothetical protein EMIT0P43_10402 [Pseudomonas jessenii]